MPISFGPALPYSFQRALEWLLPKDESYSGRQPGLEADKLRRAVRVAVHALPGRFERLICLAALQNPETRGQFSHLLPVIENWDEFEPALCREHHEIFEDWLSLPLDDKLEDLQSYAAGRHASIADIARQWFLPERRDSLVPRGALPPERRLFQNDAETLLMILVIYGIAPAS